MAEIGPKALCLLVLCLLPAAHLAASGRMDEEPAADTLRDAWTLSVTRFDQSMLPPARRSAGDVIKRSLLEQLGSVNFRLRLAPEIAFYESYEWRRSVQETAQALAQRQNERALLLFRGEPNWRHRRDLRRIDEDIEKLQEELARRESERPLINMEPTFALSQANLDNYFPLPPSPGTERRFTQEQNADAFLAGEIREFHGRFMVRLWLYILYADAFVFEDDVIFSVDDIDEAVAEIASRLASAISGVPPAQIAIRAYPPDAQILIDWGYAGTGEIEARDRPPGTVTIAVAAEGHTPETVELDLVSGELAQIDVTLAPVPLVEVIIDARNAPGTAVYHGALFVGETPLAIYLPADRLAYIALEGLGGEAARGVIAVPPMLNGPFDFSFGLRIPPPDGRVNNARRRFYWAWAGMWGAMITAWITTGIRDNMVAAAHVSADADFRARAQRSNSINNGALILLAPAAGFTIFQIVRYLGAANESSVPIMGRSR